MDILNLEWPSSDRDLHIVTPTLRFLRGRYTMETKSIFNGYFYILLYRPKLLLISNFSGSRVNQNITKLAYRMGIKVVSLISEGNVKIEDADQFLWGHNNDKKLYVNRLLLWSDKGLNIFLSKYPYLNNQLITTGASGFDRYKLLKFQEKKIFISKNNFKYKKVIGIGAWGFDHFFGKYYDEYHQYFIDIFGQDQVDMHREDLLRLQSTYKALIQSNKNTLFILRYHPGTIDYEKNEFFGLEQFENVFVSNKFTNTDYQIADLINISDLWIGYETTTALEAWLLGRQTFLINPTRSDFIRENVHKGSPIVRNESEAQKLIDEYFSNGSIAAFEELDNERRKIIKDVIGFDDGKNHVRAAKEIIKLLEQPDRKVKYGFEVYKEAFKQIIKIVLSKTILRNRWPELNYKRDFAKSYQKDYDKVIDV
jgi:hypothetical protein